MACLAFTALPGNPRPLHKTKLNAINSVAARARIHWLITLNDLSKQAKKVRSSPKTLQTNQSSKKIPNFL